MFNNLLSMIEIFLKNQNVSLTKMQKVLMTILLAIYYVAAARTTFSWVGKRMFFYTYANWMAISEIMDIAFFGSIVMFIVWCKIPTKTDNKK